MATPHYTLMKLISQGAEAKIYYFKDYILKYRFNKTYRVSAIDKQLIKRRTATERKILKTLFEAGVCVPHLREIDFSEVNKALFEKEEEIRNLSAEVDNLLSNKSINFTHQNNLSSANTIVMEYIEGLTLKNYPDPKLYYKLGVIIRKIHDLNIIHGDITSSNVIVKDEQLYLIDFGLAYFSVKDEDKAVDLWVFEKALLCDDCRYFSDFLYGYNDANICRKLEMVRLRGRKREEKAIG